MCQSVQAGGSGELGRHADQQIIVQDAVISISAVCDKVLLDVVFIGQDGTIGNFGASAGGGGDHDQAGTHVKGLCEVSVLDQGTGVDAQDVDALGAVHVGPPPMPMMKSQFSATQIS